MVLPTAKIGPPKEARTCVQGSVSGLTGRLATSRRRFCLPCTLVGQVGFDAENLESDDPYWARHIWVIEADGSNMAQLTSGPDWDDSPSWSPDGNQIIFHRVFSEGDDYIVTIDVDGSNETPLTAGSPEERLPSWSPDGANIGYVTGHGQLALVAPDGSNRREIVANHAVGDLCGRTYIRRVPLPRAWSNLQRHLESQRRAPLSATCRRTAPTQGAESQFSQFFQPGRLAAL